MGEPFKFDVTFENGSYKIKNGRDLCLEFEFIEDEDDGGTVLYISKISRKMSSLRTCALCHTAFYFMVRIINM